MVVGGGTTGAVYDRLSGMQNAEAERAEAAKHATGEARLALVNYMLRRSARPLNIARPGGGAIEPRLLMLPCPDNVEGDHNLDGTQDPTCGADGGSNRNLTNGVLSSGARFGRLPDRARYNELGEDEISDGLEGDFRGGGGRLWYALSQHFAPALNGAPLNLHRLDSRDDKWLSVVRFAPEQTPPLITVHSRVAAVVLAPGRHVAGRPSEEFVATASLDLEQINASLYFESAGEESNADANGVFVRALPSGEFDDFADYIGADEMLDADGRFLRDYLVFAGAGEVHNAPAAGSPLAEISIALAEWRVFFGFYPAPAANISVHIDERARHCAAFHTAEPASASASGIALSPVAAMTLDAPSASGTITATLQTDSAFLTMHPATLTISAGLSAALSVVLGDRATLVWPQITLARFARLTLSAGAEIIADASLLRNIGGGYALSPGATVSSATVSLSFAARTPLASPAGMLNGWLPEHHRTTMTIAIDGARITLSAPTAAGFLGAATLTSAAATITVSTGARFELRDKIKIEKDFSQLTLFYEDAILFSDGGAATLRAADGYKPTPASFARRRFVALLFSDVVFSGRTVFAPQIVYPWREENGTGAVTRDNLHPYPPCFDSRGLSRRTRTFIEDHNIYYAVSPGCHGGGLCTGGGGVSISVAAETRFAAPLPFTLAHSYTATLRGGAEEITVNLGEATRNFTVSGAFSLPLGAAAAADLTAGFTFRNGEKIVVPAGAVITAGDRTRVENVGAVLLYSPAPLANTRCLRGMPSAAVYPAAGATLAAQGGGGADLTTPCQWLDDDENADGDSLFLIRPSAQDAQTNDYFMIFGGNVIVQ